MGDSLYWLVRGRLPGSGSLRRCVLPDCDGAAPEILLDGLAWPKSLVAGQTALYWADESNRNIQTCALPTCAGGGVAVVTDLVSVGGLTISQDDLFWADATSIYHCTLPACEAKTRLVDGVGQARILSARADALAWADRDGTVAYVAR
jgi:hypothetical protein